MDVLPANWLALGVAAVLGLATHAIKEMIAFRTVNPLAVNSYFSGNWPQLALAVLSVAALVLIGDGMGTVLSPYLVYLAGLAGGSISSAGRADWGEAN